MNYLRIHDEIISNALERGKPNGYYEVHHIIPRCIGGKDTSDNLVNLTAREHYLVHWLLYKIHGSPSLGKAWHSFVMVGGKRYTSHTFSYAREAKVKSMIGSKHSPETIQKMKNRATGRKLSDETRKKLSIIAKNRICSDELRRKRSINASMKKGRTSPSFKGYYITPNGRFETSKDAAKNNNTNPKSALRRCKGLTKKDWKVLGWDFEPK